MLAPDDRLLGIFGAESSCVMNPTLLFRTHIVHVMGDPNEKTVWLSETAIHNSCEATVVKDEGASDYDNSFISLDSDNFREPGCFQPNLVTCCIPYSRPCPKTHSLSSLIPHFDQALGHKQIFLLASFNNLNLRTLPIIQRENLATDNVQRIRKASHCFSH